MLTPGDKIMTVLRRSYEGEYLRFFLGEVEDMTDSMVKLIGHSWVWDAYAGSVVQREGVRRKLVPLDSGSFLVYQLERDLPLDNLSFTCDENGRLFLARDGEVLFELAERSGTAS